MDRCPAFLRSRSNEPGVWDGVRRRLLPGAPPIEATKAGRRGSGLGGCHTEGEHHGYGEDANAGAEEPKSNGHAASSGNSQALRSSFDIATRSDGPVSTLRTNADSFKRELDTLFAVSDSCSALGKRVTSSLGLTPRLARRRCFDEGFGNFGAGTRTRTEDLLITNQLLYQLSYAGQAGKNLQILARPNRPGASDPGPRCRWGRNAHARFTSCTGRQLPLEFSSLR